MVLWTSRAQVPAGRCGRESPVDNPHGSPAGPQKSDPGDPESAAARAAPRRVAGDRRDDSDFCGQGGAGWRTTCANVSAAAVLMDADDGAVDELQRLRGSRRQRGGASNFPPAPEPPWPATVVSAPAELPRLRCSRGREAGRGPPHPLLKG